MKTIARCLSVTFFVWALSICPDASAQGDAEPASTAADEEEAFLSGEAKTEEAPADEGGKTAPEGDDPSAKDGAAAPEKWGGKKRDHRFQGFVNLLFGTGWYMVAPYDKDEPEKACSELEIDPNNPNINEEGAGDPVCTGRSPMHMDFLGGFGVKEGLEVFAMFRLGLPDPAADDHLPTQTRFLGAGIKTYSPKDGLFKVAFGVAALFDFSNRRTETYDFVIHVPIAAHFDFIPWLGAYLQVAPNISFISEFKLDITAGLGLQGRFP